MNKKLVLLGIVSTLVLSGCAGSANHNVVTAHQAGDDSLNCEDIDREITKTQVIIDGVNQDKEDVTGADVMDGILWFPFNLIAKSQNYENALRAADRRIENLQDLKTKNNCAVASTDEQNQETAKLTQQLSELNQLYKDGVLSDDEYKEAKRKILDHTGS